VTPAEEVALLADDAEQLSRLALCMRGVEAMAELLEVIGPKAYLKWVAKAEAKITAELEQMLEDA